MSSPTPSWRIQSNPVTYGVNVNNSNATIVQNTRAGATFVVTFITLIATTSPGGAQALIVEQPSGVAVHSGEVGSGQFDRFPLNCVVALQTGASLVTESVTGGWSVAATGYYTPTTVTS